MRISPHSRVAPPPVGDEATITVSSTPARRAGRVSCSRCSWSCALMLVARNTGLGAPARTYLVLPGTAAPTRSRWCGLYVVPFAGVAFLWHMIATRTLLRCIGRGPGPRSRTGCTWP